MSGKSQTARRSDREFKDNAVALGRGGPTSTRGARARGITTGSLGRWVQRANAGGAQREPATLAAETPGARAHCAASSQRTISCASSATSQKKALGIWSAEVPPQAPR